MFAVLQSSVRFAAAAMLSPLGHTCASSIAPAGFGTERAQVEYLRAHAVLLEQVRGGE